MKFGTTRWDDLTPPAAEVRPAVTETEDEQDIRYFKEYYRQGKSSFKNASDRANAIYQRGNWKASGLSWGKWAVQYLEINRCYAYSLVVTRNDAMKELIDFYKSEPPVNEAVSSRFSKSSDIQPTINTVDTKPPVVRTTIPLDAPTEPEVPANNAHKNGHVQPEEIKLPLEMGRWASKLLGLIENMPKCRIHNKLSPANIKVFESSIASLQLVLVELLPQEVPKEPCKCGCGLSPKVCHELFKVGVPSIGLTVGQAGIIMRKLNENERRLPMYFEFLRNEGEWIERKFKGKPPQKKITT